MEVLLAPYLALFLGSLGIDLGLMNRASDPEDAPPAQTAQEDDTPEAAAATEATAILDEAADAPAQTAPGFTPAAYAETIFGTAEDDSLSPEAELDLAFFLGEGDDSLDAGRGDDYAHGGAGNDVMFLRQGDDLAYGGTGDDRIDLGQGDDTGFGGSGADRLTGNGGNDVIHGEAGDDVLLGGTGSDTILGGAGNDTLAGMSRGLSTPTAATLPDGFDSLDGGAGDDLLILGPGDRAMGGAGHDRFVLDHRRDDLSARSIVQDFHEGDALELLYTPETDAEGNLMAPLLELIANEAGTGTLVMFNGQAVADLLGVSDLAPEAIRITALT